MQHNVPSSNNRQSLHEHQKGQYIHKYVCTYIVTIAFFCYFLFRNNLIFMTSIKRVKDQNKSNGNVAN